MAASFCHKSNTRTNQSVSGGLFVITSFLGSLPYQTDNVILLNIGVFFNSDMQHTFQWFLIIYDRLI